MATPIRGTQSFVGVMGRVWDRPILSLLEIAWRWFIGALLLAGAYVAFQRTNVDLSVQLARVQALTIFEPVAAIQGLAAVISAIWSATATTLCWLLPLGIVLWNVAAAIGRTLVLRRLNTKLHGRPLSLFVLGLLRACLLLADYSLWRWLMAQAARIAIIGPAARGQESSPVLYAAMIIVATLALYVVTAIVSWPFYLAPLLAMRHNLGPVAALRAAFAAGSVRGQLIEINLVLHIVKLALLVLAMVFSASPLPFTTVATQGFLELWWVSVILLYFAASDYFHVVRSAAYLSLYRRDHPVASTDDLH